MNFGYILILNLTTVSPARIGIVNLTSSAELATKTSMAQVRIKAWKRPNSDAEFETKSEMFILIIRQRSWWTEASKSSEGFGGIDGSNEEPVEGFFKRFIVGQTTGYKLRRSGTVNRNWSSSREFRSLDIFC